MKKILLASLLLASASTLASAQVIIQDSFTRSGALNNTSPDVTDTPGVKWSASSAYTTNGSDAQVSKTNNVTAQIAFNGSDLPSTSTGYVFLEANLTITDPSGNGGIALGFINTTSSNVGLAGVNWLFMNAEGAAAGITGPGNKGTSVSLAGGTDVGGTASASVVEQFDLATGVETFIIDDQDQGTLTFNPSLFSPTASGRIQEAGITINNGSTGTPVETIDNFTVAYSTTAFDTVPEPSTYALMFGGLAALVFIGRRRVQS